MKTTSTSKWLKVLIVMVATAWSLPSRADIAPTCSAYDALITCDAKDVGKACQGGGQCYAVSCGTGMTVYKCDACPAILSAPDAGCDPSKFGTACGDGGICSSTQAYCNPSSTKFVCTGPTPAKPTGPPAGESGGASGSAGTAGGSGGTSGGNASGGSGVLNGSGGTGGGNASGGSGVLGGQSGAGAAACPSCKSSGGCDVAPRATGPGAIALALLAVGMLALLYDRRRKRRR
jgi:hypothetical protein